MHKKVIRGVTYYYTTVREDGRVKTIYLGRTKEEARRKEAGLKGARKKPSLPVSRSFSNKTLYVVVLLVAIAAVAIGGNLAGYLVSVTQPSKITDEFQVGITLKAGDFLPKDIVIEVSVANHTSNLTMEDFLNKAGSNLIPEENQFYSGQIDIYGYGEGYGVKGTKKTFNYVDFQYNLTVYKESGTEYKIIRTAFNFEKPYMKKISELLDDPNDEYSVSLVPGSVSVGKQKIDDSYVSLETKDGMILAETSYIETEEGYGKGFEGQDNEFYLNLSEIGLVQPDPGEHNIITRIIYEGNVLEESSKRITFISKTTVSCEDKDDDGYFTCLPEIDCDDANPDIHPGADEICNNTIDEDCDGYDRKCPVTLSNFIESQEIEYVKKEVEEKISRRNNVRVIIKLKDESRKSDVLEEVSIINEFNDIISASINDEKLFSLMRRFTQDEIELIQIDHSVKLFLNDVVNQTRTDMVWNLSITGRGQTVCIVDSGIDYTHPNLTDNYIGGYDFVNNDSDPMDDFGHGTYVSGIVAGISPDSRILAAKVFGNRGVGYESDIMEGIRYCRDNKDTYNISVILMSFGGGIYNTSCYCDSNLVANESNYAVSKGILAVAACGNDGEAFLKAPACGTNVTSVGAVDKNDNIASFTNIEPLLDLLAPGVDVESTKSGGGSDRKSGTSISAAVVAGVAPLILENENLNPFQLQNRLRSTGSLVIYNGTNYPRVDAYAAINNQITNNPYIQQGIQCESDQEVYGTLYDFCDDIWCTGSPDCEPCCHNMDLTVCSGYWCDISVCWNSGASCDCNNAMYQCGAECDDDSDCDTSWDQCSSCPRNVNCKYQDFQCDEPNSCFCSDYTEYDPDQSTGFCSGGACCNPSVAGCGALEWNIGGEVSGTTCCANDPGEYNKNCVKHGNIAWACSSAHDGCCTLNTKCIDPDDSSCYTSGGDHAVKASGNDRIAWCSSNTWYDCDDYETSCGSSACAGGGQTRCGEAFGECSGTSDLDCCGDDNTNEYRRTCGTSGSPETFSCSGVDALCCNSGTDCPYESGGWSCYPSRASGTASCWSGEEVWCDSGSWEDVDADSTGCSRCVGSSRWGIGFEAGTYASCCGDDSGENREICVAGTGFPDAGTCDSADDMCCNNGNDCVNTDGNACTTSTTSAQGDTDGDSDYCLTGTWYDCNSDANCPAGFECDGTPGDCDNTISGGSSTTCGASDPCLYINYSGSAVARFDDSGYVDVKGGLYESQSGLSCSNCFQINDTGGTTRLYIDSSGNLYMTGTFNTDTSPTPAGNNDFQIKNSGGTVVGYIDGATGNMYFMGALHYNSDF